MTYLGLSDSDFSKIEKSNESEERSRKRTSSSIHNPLSLYKSQKMFTDKKPFKINTDQSRSLSNVKL